MSEFARRTCEVVRDSWDSGCGNVIVQQSTGGDISLVAAEGSRNFASGTGGSCSLTD